MCLAVAGLLSAFAVRAFAQDTARSGGWIAIPETEYQMLRAKAFPAEPLPEAPPVQATLTRIHYDLRIQGDFASGQASLVIDVIKGGSCLYIHTNNESYLSNSILPDHHIN